MTDPSIVPHITLIDATTTNRTIIAINGDATTGNLVKHRKQGSYSFSGIRRFRHGKITLRAVDGLFVTKAPILVRPEDFTKYYIEVQFFQPTKAGDTGHPNPIGRVGELVRYELSQPVQDADEKGQTVTIELTAIEQRVKFSYDSESHRLRTPKKSFMDRVNHYGNTRGTGAPLVFFASDANINLPDDQFLKQDWIPGPGKTTHDLLIDIIEKLAQPTIIGGNFEDQYYYFVTHPTITNTLEIFAEEFGIRDASGRGTGAVVLDATKPTNAETYEKRHTMITDSSKLANVFIVRGANGTDSLPQSYAIFASDWEHAKISSPWAIGVDYIVGDFVSFGGHLHRCIVAHNSSTGEEPIPDTFNLWEDLNTSNRDSTDSSATDFWTLDVDFWKAMMSGLNPTGDGAYVGHFVDINIVNPNYDRTVATDEFETVSTKDYDRVVNNPASTSELPTAEIHHGKRVRVGTAPVGTFAGMANRIAQYFDPQDGFTAPVWKFSRAPITDELISERGATAGQIMRWNGTTWVQHWSLLSTPDTSSPFHPVKAISIVAGPDGVKLNAVQFEFDYNDNPLDGGNIANRASRWAGFNIRIPAVPRAQGARTVGDFIKTPTLDWENLSKNPKTNEKSNWNDGVNTMDLGNLRGLAGKINFDFRDKANNKINGLANLTARFWFRDLQDHRVFKDVKIRATGDFISFKSDAGPGVEMQLHDDRTDELYKIFGVTLPFNYFIKEKDYSGIVFDWNHVKEFGMMYLGSYDENVFYKGAEGDWIDKLQQFLQQAFSTLVTGSTTGFFIVDKCFLKLSDFRFIKDPYVSTSDVAVSNARVRFANATNFFDRITLRGIGAGLLARAQHYPQFSPIEAYVDVRVRLGEKFTAQGPRWQGSPRTLTCSEYTIHEGEDGTRMEMLGYEKF